jgi:replicative DNA helicase
VGDSPNFSLLDERSMLGWLMEHPETAAVLDLDGVWYADISGRLHALILERFAEGEATSMEAIGMFAADTGRIGELGGWDGLAACFEARQRSSKDAKNMASTLRRRAMARNFQRVLTKALATATAGAERSEDTANQVIEELSSLLAQSSDPGMKSIQKIMLDLQDMDRELERTRRARYLRTGLHAFDEKFGGIVDRGVTVIMGASGMGKTSVLNTMALGLALNGNHVTLHGTETSYDDRGNDMSLALAGVPFKDYYTAIADGSVQDDMRLSVLRAREAIHALPITVSGARGATVDVVCGRIRSLHRAGKCQVAVIDYLQDFREVSAKDVPRGNRQVQIGYASRRLKELSNELAIPVIVGAQVSGEKDENPDPRPQMWDVQWSSQAHQDAEEVFTLYREDYYMARFPDWANRTKVVHGQRGMIEIIQRKGRKAGPGTANELFHGPTKWVGEPWTDIRHVAARPQITDRWSDT